MTLSLFALAVIAVIRSRVAPLGRPKKGGSRLIRLSVEYKINLLRPAKGERLVARARVVRTGRTLTVCAGDVYAQNDGAERVVATMLATVMAVPQRDDLRQ